MTINEAEEKPGLTLSFYTDSFSVYCFGSYYGDYTNPNSVNDIPDTLYIGETMQFQGYDAKNYLVSNVTNECIDLSERGDNQHRVLSIINEGTFTLQHTTYPRATKTFTVKSRKTTPYSNTIDTVNNSDIGITMSLFDYDLDNQLNELWCRTYDGQWSTVRDYYMKHGINNGHVLKFWAGGPNYTSAANHPEYNAWLGDKLGKTIVSTDINSKGYPQTTSGESLEYLFEKKDGTDKKYYPANKLFSEENGYYVYNSGMTSDGGAGHYAYYNKDTKEFEVYDKTYYYTKDGKQFPIGFFPFSQLDEDAVKNGFLSSNQYPNHHFGMSMDVDFDIPEDKLDPNDNHITFEFSGDDDMWVFVDGKIVLDIGGIHQPIGGKIDFTTGEVTYQDKNGGTLIDNAYSPDLDNLIGDRNVAVNSFGTHKLQVFYMERGGGDSNCMIKFNTIPYKRIKFNKIDADNNRIPGAEFKLYKDEQCTQPLMIPRSKIEGGHTVNYYEEATSISNNSGEVIFDKIPVGTYYMKETSAPTGYDPDGKVYTAVVTASRVGDPADDNYATIYWKNKDHLIGNGVINYKQRPLQVTKKWVKAGTTDEAQWPEGCQISYKVIRHVYLETDDGLKEIPDTSAVIFTAEDDALLTKTHDSHVIENLSQVGKWKSPLAITVEMQALGIESNKEYPVTYKYTVEENPAGSVLPAGSPYVLLPVQAEMTENTDVTVNNETVHGNKGLLTNEITELSVLKKWSDDNKNHTNDKVTVQLYRVSVENDTPPVHDDPADEKISILVNTRWLYENGTSADLKNIPKSGKIVAQISDGENSWTVELNPDNNWTATKSDLPKKGEDGKNITYTVTYLQQQSGGFGGVNVQRVVVTQPSAVVGANGKVTLEATVKKPDPVNTTMAVPFDATWVNDKGESVTPPDNGEITAVVKDADGVTVATVVLKKSNNWAYTQTLPCIKDDETVQYTVEYSGKGDYVTGADGTRSFSGQGSAAHAVGQITIPEVSEGKMALQVVANGIKATGNDQWMIQINQSVHRVDQNGNDIWDKNQYSFPDGILNDSTTSSTITEMNVKDSDNQTIRYKLHVQAEHITSGTISVVNPNGNVIKSQNFTDGWTGDLYFNAQPGTFTVRINGENAAKSRKTAVRKMNAAPLKAGGDQKTFTDEISHSGLILPADADPVGDPVELNSGNEWKFQWQNLPVKDSEGNTYYYYLKEVSATTSGIVYELGAVYEYDNYSGESGRIRELTITNTPIIIKSDVQIKKVDDDETLLSNVPFTLWQKGGTGSSGGEYIKVEGYTDVKTENGILTFEDLLPGDYKITEGTPLPGYLDFSEEVPFTLSVDGKLTGFENTELVKLNEEDGTFIFTIINQKGVELPSTGGPGTRLFTILGAVMICLAGVLLWRRQNLV